MNTESANDIRELTDDELESVTGGNATQAAIAWGIGVGVLLLTGGSIAAALTAESAYAAYKLT
jgi:lactobin A/cerein 7B family class IIb bacteriocin